MAVVGEQLAHYRIETLLGAGGMGEVYVAFDQTLERRVALKLLPEGRALHAEARARMLREARAASALAHPGIVTVYEIGEAAGRTYIAMELVDGETLSQLLARRGALPPAEAVALLRQVGDAIVVAHAAGILHRDLKTANLMLDRGGRLKVLDFGLSKRLGAPSQPPMPRAPARRVDPEAETVSGDPAPIDPRGETVTPELANPVILSEGRAPARPESKDAGLATPSGDVVTVHGARMGTPGSAAPELMDGEDADVRSDVFSLGVVLHELVTGKPPFPWTSWEDIRLRILERRYRRASEVVPGAAGGRLDAVIARALAPARDDRHATVPELVLAAEAAVRTSRRRWPAIAGAGAVTAAGVAIAVISWPRASRTGLPMDAGPPGPVTAAMTLPPPRAVTSAGGCAYTPAFLDDRTIVYDLTTDARRPDLWTVPVTGGEPAQLTDGIGWEWRAAPGLAPGKVVFLVDDPEREPGAAEQGIAQVDLATREIAYLNKAWAPAAVAARGDLYYLIAGGGELRRLRAGIDELIASLPDERASPQQLAASADGRFVAIAGPPPDVPLMVVELAAEKMTPLPAEAPGNSRPAFSIAADAIYYLGAAGVRRIRVDGTGDELIGPKLRASGGIAVSPDGAYLVYSDCDQRTTLLDVTAQPQVELDASGYAAEPIAGPGGWLAWIEQDQGDAWLMVRRPDGTIEQLTSRAVGRVSSPSFDDAGAYVAFTVRGGDHPGIHTMALSEGDGTRRMFPVTGSERDFAPLFVGEELVFAREDDTGFPQLMITAKFGGQTRPAFDQVQIGMALSVSGNGHVLIGMGPSHDFQMWSPKTGKSSRLTLPAELVGIPRFSPNGEWIVVTGAEEVWRLHLGKDGQTVDTITPEKVFTVPRDGLAGFATISDDGHVIVAPSAWRGEIHAVAAPRGTRW